MHEADAAMGTHQERAASDIVTATAACIGAARKADRRTSMTPSRASWSGSPADGWTVGTETSPLQAEALQALQELCHVSPAPYADDEIGGLFSNIETSRVVTEGTEAKPAVADNAAPLSNETGAVATLRLAAQTAARLGLDEALRNAADAAALQLRVWDGQSAALLAQAWTIAPAGSRTVSCAGMAEPNIRLSSTGTGLDPDNKNSTALPRTAARRLSAQPGVHLRAAVSVVWSCRNWASCSAEKAVLCWPQSNAAASEHARQQWQTLQTCVQQTCDTNMAGCQLKEAAIHDDAPACLTCADSDAISLESPDEGSRQADNDEMAAQPTQRCAGFRFLRFTCSQTVRSLRNADRWCQLHFIQPATASGSC